MSKNSKVYYDDDCYVCSFEIKTIRKRGEKCGIEFIDISNIEGDYYQKEMIGEFEGKETKGPETFRKMYETLGFKKLVAVSRLPVIKTVLDLGYYTFAYVIRPILPKRKKR